MLRIRNGSPNEETGTPTGTFWGAYGIESSLTSSLKPCRATEGVGSPTRIAAVKPAATAQGEGTSGPAALSGDSSGVRFHNTKKLLQNTVRSLSLSLFLSLSLSLSLSLFVSVFAIQLQETKSNRAQAFELWVQSSYCTCLGSCSCAAERSGVNLLRL